MQAVLTGVTRKRCTAEVILMSARVGQQLALVMIAHVICWSQRYRVFGKA